MKVKLISYSSPYNGENDKKLDSLDELVAFCARVSNPENQYNTETANKLIRYLIKNKHWSPLEMVNICLEIETTRDIARQILRHRSFSFQEFSQRYANPVDSLDFTTREARLQDMKNRQNSVETHNEELNNEWKQKQEEVIKLSREVYNWAISNNIAKEQARVVLPEGLTVSRLYVNGSLRSWIHYIQLRSGNGTQKEHLLIAKECAKVISTVFKMCEEFVSS